MGMEIKRGDLMPPLRGQCLDDGTPVPLDTGVTSMAVIGWRGQAMLFKRAVTGDVDGKWTMQWQAGDTSVVGDLLIEVEVVWAGGKPQTFPGDGYEVVHVTQDLG